MHMHAKHQLYSENRCIAHKVSGSKHKRFEIVWVIDLRVENQKGIE